MLFVQENVGEPIAMEKAFSATLPYDDCNAVFAIMALIRAYAFLSARLVSSGCVVIGSKMPSIIRDAIALEDFQWTTEHEIARGSALAVEICGLKPHGPCIQLQICLPHGICHT